VDINNGKLEKKEAISNPGHSPGSIPQFLHDKGVDLIIAGGMGMRAKGFFEEFGIRTIMGINGTIEDVIKRLTEGTLKGGTSLCDPGSGKGYGIEKEGCDHEN